MSDNSHIQWTDATWNFVTGCTKVSPGCEHCYIERTPPFRMAGRKFDQAGIGGTTGVRLHSDRLSWPQRWRKPRMIFGPSLADPFHDDVPDRFLADAFAVMALCPRHRFQMLTKRPARARSLLNDPAFQEAIRAALRARGADDTLTWPLPQLWLGVSAENQQWADIRIPLLLATPAAVRWVSAEPLLGPIDLGNTALRPYERQQGGHWDYTGADPFGNGKTWVPAPPMQLDWVVAGGESGPGARPMLPAWARSLRDQCAAAGVPYFFKQWGEWAPTGARGIGPVRSNRFFVKAGPDEQDEQGSGIELARLGKKLAGRVLDGRTWDEYPAEVA